MSAPPAQRQEPRGKPQVSDTRPPDNSLKHIIRIPILLTAIFGHGLALSAQ